MIRFNEWHKLLRNETKATFILRSCESSLVRRCTIVTIFMQLFELPKNPFKIEHSPIYSFRDFFKRIISFLCINKPNIRCKILRIVYLSIGKQENKEFI